MRTFILSMFLAVAVMSIGCDSKPDAGRHSTSPTQRAPNHDDHDGHDHAADGHNHSSDSHDHAADGHDHSTDKAAGQAEGHTGEVVDLGSTRIGDLTVRASRDKGNIKPGGDAPIDVWITTADGKPATVTAVRFWIGSEDAKGSVKAKAEIEDPKQPYHWHAHAEVPDPLPEASKLWVEIETSAGRTSGAFGLGST